MMIPGTQVMEALEGVQFPATKQELLDYAFRQFASEDIAHALDELPDIEYASLDIVEEVLRGVH
jgi:hypothetical protein